MTINDPDIIAAIIANNGAYHDDLPIIKIVVYTNAWGGTAYGCVAKGQDLNTYAPSRFILNPVTIFERHA